MADTYGRGRMIKAQCSLGGTHEGYQQEPCELIPKTVWRTEQEWTGT